MTVRDCIINNIPIWRLKFDGWIVKWTKDNKSDEIKNEIWYMIDDKIYKSDVKNFKVDSDGFVWFKNVIDNSLYKESVEEEIDEKETLTCLFKFYHFVA